MRFAKLGYVVLACTGTGFVSFACGSDVEEDPIFSSDSTGAGAAGGNGAGGSGASSSSAGTTVGSSVASSSSAGPTSSSSSGGGGFSGECEEACDKIANECGFGPVCQQVDQLDCATNPNADCYGQCILDASCAEIATLATQNPDPGIVACASACGQSGQGGAGGGGGGDCQGCAQDNCQSRGIACFTDSECQAWINCVQQCADPGCVDTCDAMHASAEPLYSALRECLCTSCTTECAVLDPCGA